MSRPRVITGVDERGRPKAAWAEAPTEPPPYAFMQPALQPVVERRKATSEELAAARAREDEPSHLTTDNSRTTPIGLAPHGRTRPVGPTDAERLQASRQRGAERHVEVVAARRPPPAPEPSPEEEAAMVEGRNASEAYNAGVEYAKPEPQPLDTFQSLSEAAANASEAWARRQAAEMAWTIAQEALEATLGEVEAILHPPILPPVLVATAAPDETYADRLAQADAFVGGLAAAPELAEHELGLPPSIGGGPAKRHYTKRRDSGRPRVEDLPLTARQEKMLAAAVRHRGDRKAVAAEFGLTAFQSVDKALENIGRKGLLPIELIALLPARFAKYSAV